MAARKLSGSLYRFSRRDRRKTTKLLGWCLVVLISAAVAFYPACHHRKWLTERTCQQIEYYHMVMCCDLSRYVYEQTGIIVSDLATLYSTAFYPFRQPLRGCDMVQRRLQIMHRTGMLEWQGMWQYGSKVFVGSKHEVRVQSAALPQGERTKHLLRAYSRGSVWWRQLVTSSHRREDDQVRTISRLCTKYCADNLIMKNAPLPLAFDLPRDERELREYIEWLHRILGFGLVDEWQRAVRISWEGTRVIFRSAGSDGIFGNRDDISVVISTDKRRMSSHRYADSFRRRST